MTAAIILSLLAVGILVILILSFVIAPWLAKL